MQYYMYLLQSVQENNNKTKLEAKTILQFNNRIIIIIIISNYNAKNNAKAIKCITKPTKILQIATIVI